jgi:hypothetical protein
MNLFFYCLNISINFAQLEKGKFNIFQLQTFIDQILSYLLNIATYLNVQFLSVEQEVFLLEYDLLELINSFKNSLKEKPIFLPSEGAQKWFIYFFYKMTFFFYKKCGF